jgi:hypothetical protein
MGVAVLAWNAMGAASAADENRLPIGVRHVIAVVIEEYGFNCPAVKDIQEVGYEWPGYVMKVTCGPFGDAQGWPDRPLRVVGYTEGDYTVTRWKLNSLPRPETFQPRRDHPSSPVKRAAVSEQFTRSIIIELTDAGLATYSDSPDALSTATGGAFSRTR